MPAAIVFSQVKIAPPPPNFSGDLKEVFALLEVNLQVKNPSGYNTFVSGPDAPVSDQGPWLKDGKQWYIWDSATLTYIPQIMTDADARDIPEGTSLPAGATASRLFFLVWPNVGRQLFRWDGVSWNVVGQLAGNTAQRPISPVSYTQYFDNQIGALLYLKPGFGWVTVSGAFGDIKFVSLPDEATALQYNPGWGIYGPAKGRAVAGHNGGANGFTDAATGTANGTETHTITEAELPPHDHDFAGYNSASDWANDVNRIVMGPVLTVGGTPQWMLNASSDGGPKNSSVRMLPAGGGFPTNITQPTLYLIPLQKVQ